MNKYIRLIFIRMEKKHLQREMDNIYGDYCNDVPAALQKMNDLQQQYNKLCREEQELRDSE